MIQEAMKTERGKFLLYHLLNCNKCYKEWESINRDLPKERHIAKLEEIINYTHPDTDII